MYNKIRLEDIAKVSEQRKKLKKSPELVFLFFELCDECNLSCLHCGSCSSPEKRTFLKKEDIFRVIDSYMSQHRGKMPMICLTGGEPMLHPDIFEIILGIRNRNLQCGMTTNGTLITDKIAARLHENGLLSVSVSLDGDKKEHDLFRRSDGSFDKAVRGIKALKNAGIITQITTVFHKKNLHTLEGTFRLAQSLGVHSWRPINIEPIGRALDHPELLLSTNETNLLLSFIKQKRFDAGVEMDVTFGCSHYLGEKYERFVRDEYFLCGAGIRVASVACNGDIIACLDIERRPELVQGNIGTDDFYEVWKNRFEFFRSDRRTGICGMCSECEHKDFCDGDSAHTWDYDNNRPMLCLKGEKSGKLL